MVTISLINIIFDLCFSFGVPDNLSSGFAFVVICFQGGDSEYFRRRAAHLIINFFHSLYCLIVIVGQ
jgi:hypothetical protein